MFKRFIVRQGKVSNVFTDSGTNFIGANSGLKELYEMFAASEHKDKLTNAFTEDEITLTLGVSGRQQ